MQVKSNIEWKELYLKAKQAAENKFSQKMRNYTFSVVDKYGLEAGKNNRTDHNNQADAFKHTYMQWWIAYRFGNEIAKKLGDKHEYERTGNPSGEQNMDLWNNQIGRELAEEMKQKLGKDIHLVDAEWLNNLATDKILKKMNRGELITNPNDKRRYENMDLERLKESDKVYTLEELESMDEKTKSQVWDNQVRHFREGNWGLPYKNHLESAAQKGDLIYVNSYTRADGTVVSGYYRKRK